jgi:hypothetical protein
MRVRSLLRSAPAQRSTAVVALLLMAVLLGGCKSYSTSVRDAQQDLARGKTEDALKVLNKRLEVERAEDVPEKLKKDRVLLLLERATLLQALGRYDLAARDMVAVDQRLLWLDLDGEKSADLAKYMYSASSTPYRAPAYERMLLNTLNMVNFMALGDMQGAKVEARRFALLEELFVRGEGQKDILLASTLATGNYLGGVAFESARNYDVAVRFYGRAWAYGFRDASFRAQLVDLIRTTGWKGAGAPPDVGDLDAIIAGAQSEGALRPSEYRNKHVANNVVAVVQTGLVPYLKPERIPIGLALTYHAAYHGQHSMTAEQRANANRLAVSGALKWVNFGVLTESRVPDRAVVVSVDGKTMAPPRVADISDQVRQEWQRIAAATIGLAILRMMTRAVAGGATRSGTRAAAKDDSSGLAVVGWLAGVALEGAMTAADVPDTRSWTTLPARIHVARFKSEPGSTTVTARVGAQTETRVVEVVESTVRVVNFSRHR